MSFLLGLLFGAIAGYVGSYFQHNPDKRAELIGLFKKKPPS